MNDTEENKTMPHVDFVFKHHPPKLAREILKWEDEAFKERYKDLIWKTKKQNKK